MAASVERGPAAAVNSDLEPGSVPGTISGMFPRIVLTLLLCLQAAAADAQQAEPPLPNVVLITVDTLRADQLSSYGYHLRTTPNMDQLAAEGAELLRGALGRSDRR